MIFLVKDRCRFFQKRIGYTKCQSSAQLVAIVLAYPQNNRGWYFLTAWALVGCCRLWTGHVGLGSYWVELGVSRDIISRYCSYLDPNWGYYSWKYYAWCKVESQLFNLSDSVLYEYELYHSSCVHIPIPNILRGSLKWLELGYSSVSA